VAEKKAGASKATIAAPSQRKTGEWSEAAVRVLRERYLLRDAKGVVVETPDDMAWRVANAVASAEEQWTAKGGAAPDTIAEQFYSIMVERKFLPNSPTLMNAGKGNNLQLSACYVVPVEDSLNGIFEAVKHAALIHQSGGGTGFSFSRLRPEGSMVASTHGVASGPISFMKIFDGATEAVKQGGCVVPETRVSVSSGLVQIGTLGPTEAEPKSWHALAQPLAASTDEGSRRVEEFYHNGLSKVRRIQTNAGYSFTGTLEHRVRVIDAQGQYVWRHLTDVQVGDWVALQKHTYADITDYHFAPSNRIPHFNAGKIKTPERPSAELGEFIGYLIGDGTINFYNHGGATGRLIMSVADAEPEVGARLLELADTLFGVTPQVRKKPDDASTNYFFNSTELVAWLAHIGVTKPGSQDVRVPEEVFRAGAEFARGFVRGLFTADGTVSTEGYPSLSSVSRGLVEDVQQLLLALGIPSAISVVENRESALGKNPLYRLRPMTRAGLREFADCIGFMTNAKNDRLDAGLEKAWEFNDVIPNQQMQMAALYDGPGRGSGPDRGSRGANRALYRDIQHYLSGVAAPRNLTRSRLQTLAEKHPAVRESVLAAFLTNEQFYDQIASIEDGEAVTVDLSVEGNHTYIANGFVSHNTRRGANMGILRVDHPDILKFIDCKRDGSVTNFNISVAITDTFMRALDANTEYELIDPHTKTVTGTLNAREVMNAIVAAAWATGDPGLVFIDRANASPANPVPEIELLEATNPCVVGETRLATSNGLARMDVLRTSGQRVNVATDWRAPGQQRAETINGASESVASIVSFHEAEPVFQTGTLVPVRKLITSHGIEITATPNHRFLTTEGYKYLAELEYGDELLLQSGEGAWSTNRALPNIAYGTRSESRLRAKIARGEAAPPAEWTAELGEVLGYVVGDGYVRRGDTADIIGIAVAAEDEAIASSLRSSFARWFGAAGNATVRHGHIQIQYAGSAATLLMGLGVSTARAHEKRVPESLWSAPRDAVIGFLRGLFSADGSVQVGSSEKGTCSVRLATSSKGLAQDVQQLLLNLGVVSAIRLRRESQIRLMPNTERESAEYATQAQYEVIIDKENRDRFAQVIGFMQERKQQRLQDWIATKKRASNRESFTTKVALIEDAGTADVFDTTEPTTHSIIVNGLVTHNCGEQWLGAYDACNLGSINLGLFVHGGEIDWDGLESATRITTRFLDDVIEINPYPLKEVRDKVQANRRIGLGVMGWAEMLFELNVRYDSEEAVALGEKIMVAICDWSTDESAKLAEVRGPFPNWERSIYKHGPQLRNSTRTTVAPTGSISILADCSSGIEPIFALAFQHRVKQPDGSYRVLDFVNPFFARALAASDIVDKEAVLAYIKEHGSLHGHAAAEHPALAPYVTAHEIAPEWHIRMQAAFQKGVNNSISKTINLPNSATYDDVRSAYMQAWELGCLGITVFRDGSKGEQVLNVGVKEKQPEASAADLAALAEARAKAKADEERHQRYQGGVKERPEVIKGYTRQVRAPEGKVNVTLNSDDDGLLEVFVNIGKAGSDVAALAEALGRLISLHLRIDSPISQNQRAEEISRQLRAIGGSTSIGFGAGRVRSLPDAVARAIDMHLASLSGETESHEAPYAEAADDDKTAANGSNGYANGNGSGGGLHPGLNPMMLAPYSVTGNLCTQCGNNTMRYEEGCKKCVSCGYSEC
jgi:ribonucleoside-diphosphate reductase alpha chain